MLKPSSKPADPNPLAWAIVDEPTDGNRDPLDLGLERCECLAIGTVADHGPHGVHRTPPVKRSPAPGAFISSQGVNGYLIQPLIQPGWTLADARGQQPRLLNSQETPGDPYGPLPSGLKNPVSAVRSRPSAPVSDLKSRSYQSLDRTSDNNLDNNPEKPRPGGLAASEAPRRLRRVVPGAK